jgi:hypothetical protein
MEKAGFFPRGMEARGAFGAAKTARPDGARRARETVADPASLLYLCPSSVVTSLLRR